MELIRSLFEDKSIEGVREIALEFANTKHDCTNNPAPGLNKQIWPGDVFLTHTYTHTCRHKSLHKRMSLKEA
jgi:hypothetical protein